MKSIKKFLFKVLGIKNVNKLRAVKWKVLNYFINDEQDIKGFYDYELEVRVIEKLDYCSIEKISPLFVDVGANIGRYSYYLQKLAVKYGGYCIGFEPRTDLFVRLLKNVPSTRFTAENSASSNIYGFATLFKPTSHGQSSLIKMPEFEGVDTENVRTVPLDSYLDKKVYDSIALLKIDVEGHEFEVIDGAIETIKKYRPIILCESENRHLHNQGKSTEELIDAMIKLDYVCYVISKLTLDFISVGKIKITHEKDAGEQYYYNYWFIPNEWSTEIISQANTILKGTSI